MFVWAVVALHTALMAAYTFLYPAYLGFDEPQHVDMVIALQHHDGWPAPGERAVSQGVARSSDRIYHGDLQAPPVKRTPDPRSQRPSLENLGGDRPSADAGRLPNQMVQHPPLYYATGALLLDLNPWSSSLHWDQTVWVLRLLSVLLLAPLPLLAWAVARRLSLDHSAAMAASALPLAIPGLTRLGALVNNDNLMILMGSAVAVVLVTVALGDLSLRTAAVGGVLLGLALLSKGFALGLPLAVLAAYAVGWWLTRAGPPWRPVLLWGAISFVLGGWWWLRNLLVFHALQPNGWGAAAVRANGPTLPEHLQPSFGAFWHMFRVRISDRFAGSLGLFAPPTLPHAYALAIVWLLLVGIALGLVVGTGRRGGRWAMLVVLIPTLIVFTFLVQNDYGYFHRTGRRGGIQGRYLYSGVVGAAAVVGIGASRALRGARRVLPAVTVALVVTAQVLAVRAIVTTYWLPADPRVQSPWHAGRAFSTILEWSPWPAWFTAVPFVLCAVAGVAVVVLAVREVVRPGASDLGPAATRHASAPHPPALA